jgi:hypothetical protein
MAGLLAWLDSFAQALEPVSQHNKTKVDNNNLQSVSISLFRVNFHFVQFFLNLLL